MTDLTTIDAFLNSIHGSDASIYFHVDGKTWKNKPQTYEAAESKLRWLNQNGNDIYFIVNSGGTKDASISRINSVFIDWDAGRMDSGEYFPLDEVAEKKDHILPRIQSFDLPCSHLVDTRNGYQAYWLLDRSASVDQFRDCQRRLIAYFDSDPSIKNPARVMRLPGYDWKKDGYQVYPVRIIEGNGQRYDIQEIIDALPAVQKQSRKRKGEISTPNINWSHKYTPAYIGGTLPPSLNRTVANVAEAIHLLKQISLADHLHLNEGTVHCPFHDDTKPSASIFQGNDSYWRLKCHSSSCGFRGSIIDVKIRLDAIDQSTAIKRLNEQYEINVQPDALRNQALDILEFNIRWVEQIDEIKIQYPSIYRCISRVRHDLRSKLLVARDKMFISKHIDHGEVPFFASLRYFEQRRQNLPALPVYKNGQNRRVDRYCLLGLLRKLPSWEIPSNMLQHAKDLQEVNNREFRTQYYAIPKYTDEVLADAERVAEQIHSEGIRLNGICRTMVEDMFGPDIAQRIYPQAWIGSGSVSDTAFMEEVETVLWNDIEGRGYSSSVMIVDALRESHDWKWVTQRRVWECLPSLFKQHELVEVYCNKQLKQQYQIERAGYPKIIVKASDLVA